MSEFPVKSFAEAYEHLRRPFMPEAVQFKLQATWDHGENRGGGMVICYVDARLVTARLNKVCPQLWSETYEQLGKGLICHLTIDGLTRSDYGVNSSGDAEIAAKGTYSDALKRAAVRFGVGESLYATPQMTVNEGSALKRVKNNKFRLTAAGQSHCRGVYSEWLDRYGKQAFGEPLDHGDSGKQTDAQLLAELIEDAGLSDEERTAIREWAKNGNGLDPLKVTKAIKLIEADEVGVLAEVVNRGE